MARPPLICAMGGRRYYVLPGRIRSTSLLTLYFVRQRPVDRVAGALLAGYVVWRICRG